MRQGGVGQGAGEIDHVLLAQSALRRPVRFHRFNLILVIRHEIYVEARGVARELEEIGETKYVVVRQCLKRRSALEKLFDVLSLCSDRVDELFVRVAMNCDYVCIVIILRR